MGKGVESCPSSSRSSFGTLAPQSPSTNKTKERPMSFSPPSLATPVLAQPSLAVPPPADRHLIRRFSYGFNGELAQVARRGEARRWWSQQLAPQQVADNYANSMLQWFPSLQLTPQQRWQGFSARRLSSTLSSDDFACWTILRRIHSRRQVHEVMVEFWSNLLHIASPHNGSWPHRPDYDQLLRRHALGRFDEMLAAAITHPAMLLYLDNYLSTKDNPNENLGRELLELHTVGARGGYTERDVKDSTRILTGWTVDRAGTWRQSYDSSTHATGPVRVMGFTAANGDRDGRSVTYRYLRYLAHHPATAHRIARRLAIRFVSDRPSQGLVDRLARTFQSSGTDIQATLRALVADPEFLGSRGVKIRTPIEDYVASCRALRLTVLRPERGSDFANLCVWQTAGMGQRPFDWPSPDGFPDVGRAWSSATRVMASWEVHHTLASQSRPKTGVRYRPVREWVPRLPMRFRGVVDHVCRDLLAHPSSPKLVQAASAATGIAPDEIIRPGHALLEWRMPLLIACLLDSPANMTR